MHAYVLVIIYASVAHNFQSLKGNMRQPQEMSVYTVHKHDHYFKGDVFTKYLSRTLKPYLIL